MRPALMSFAPVRWSDGEAEARSEPPTMQMMRATAAGSWRSCRTRLRWDVATWCTPSLPNLEAEEVRIRARDVGLDALQGGNSHPAQNGIRHRNLKPALSLPRTLPRNPIGRLIRSANHTRQPRETKKYPPPQTTHMRFSSPKLASSSGLMPTLPNIALHSRSLTSLGVRAAATPRAAPAMRTRQNRER